MNILQVYEPALGKSNYKVEEFYDSETKIINKSLKNEIKRVIGDFHAKIGKGREDKYLGVSVKHN